MKLTRPRRIAAFTALLLTSSAQADFVLFGDHQPARYEQPKRFEPIVPISNPYYNDDAIIRTDIRFTYSSTRVDHNESIGGNIDQFILQPHLAVTPQLEVGINKLGFIGYPGDDAFPDMFDDGFDDLGVTVKYAFYQNYERQLFMAVGGGYEFAAGDEEAMTDDDQWRVFFAVNKGIGALHLGGNVNLLFTDGDDNGFVFVPQTGPAQEFGFGDAEFSLIWNVHADIYFGPYFSAIAHVSGFHGFNREPDRDESISAFNFEDPPGNIVRPFDISMADIANTSTGGDIYFASLGGELRPLPTQAPNFGVRGALELPFRIGTSADTKFEYRVVFGLIYKF